MKKSTEDLIGCAMALIIISLGPTLLSFLVSLIVLAVILAVVAGIEVIIFFPLVVSAIGIWIFILIRKAINRKYYQKVVEFEQYVQELPHEYRDYVMAVLDEDGLTEYERRILAIAQKHKRILIIGWAAILIWLAGSVWFVWLFYSPILREW